MPRPVAIATCREFPALHPDDHPLVTALSTAGIESEPVLWDDDVEWRRFRGVLLRSVWDYPEKEVAFRAWLDRLERAGTPCWNPVPLVRWNLDKLYLRELAAKGVPIPPTLFVERSPRVSAQDVVARIVATGWPEVVVKPSVSGGAWRTLRLGRKDVPARAAALEEILAASSLIVQPFLPEVVEQGEWSFLFFGGEFSHAVIKRPQAGDFRVQWSHGGSHVRAAAPPGLVAQARAVLHAAPSPGLYARVDGVVRDGTFLLMELEQIEPYLFFAEDPPSVERFVRALATRLDA